jgi:DNA-binding HxlR family transcriptional regulator
MRSLDKYEQPYDALREECGSRAGIDVIQGRWKPSILFVLGARTLRFSELQKGIPGVSAQALTLQLRQLEADGVVARRVVDDSPVRVEYSLTASGKELLVIVDALCDWGLGHLARTGRLGEVRGPRARPA